MNLVTGYRGTKHVTSADMAAFNRVIFGDGDYVIQTGDCLAASYSDTNILRILDGEMLIQGHHARIKVGTYEEVALTDGTSGTYRKDYIVAEYVKASDGTESVTIKDIVGEEASSASAATLPTLTMEDLTQYGNTRQVALYTVTFSGLSAGDPVQVFDPVNSLFTQVQNLISYTSDSDAYMELFCGSSPYARNGVWRGKDLTDVYTVDELHEKVAAGDFTDLYIGDYIDVSMTTDYGGTESVRLRFAHFDYFLNSGSSKLTDHRSVMVPEDCFATAAAMNSSATTEGGYYGSAMHTTVLPVYYEALNSVLGGHILTHSRYLTTDVNTTATSGAGCNLTGTATGAGGHTTQLCLMSEPMIYGCAVFSSSGRDISDACNQLALFAMAPNMRCAHRGSDSGTWSSYWLNAVASSANFSRHGSDSFATYYSAGNEAGVRPYFLFG